MNAKVEAKILELRRQGLGLIKIGKQVGCGTATVQRIVAEQEA